MDTQNRAPLVAAVAVVAVLGGVGYYLLHPVPAPQAAPAPAAPAPPPSPAAAPLILPPLDSSDAFLRNRLGAVASLPAAWLSADNIARRLVAALQILAAGGVPHDSLSFLRPARAFKAKRLRGAVVVDPASYARYDAVGAVAASVNAQAAARLVKDLSPLFAQACAELDSAHCDFQVSLNRSISELLAVPAVSGDLRLKRRVVSWAFADPKLESLNGAQKLLLRMGPSNQAKIQAKLREFATALSAS